VIVEGQLGGQGVIGGHYDADDGREEQVGADDEDEALPFERKIDRVPQQEEGQEHEQHARQQVRACAARSGCGCGQSGRLRMGSVMAS
jgi:hypothetical protein